MRVENVMTVRLHEVGKVSAAVKEPDKLAVALGEAVVVEKDAADYYDGAYDVRVDMIPTREIPNAAGGVTFIVGG